MARWSTSIYIEMMAMSKLRIPGNAAGDFFVDSTCIDCDLCRQIAPEVFRQEGDQSVVYRQPDSRDVEFRALKALVTCPTASIGAEGTYPVREAAQAYPERIEDEVYFCGYASDASFGASSYLIVRPEGNILVDSPRFAKPLVKRIEQMGGIRFMFLTHRDDIADHRLWNEHFGADRILHERDSGKWKREIEILVKGRETVSLAPDLLVIPTPGHTKGHQVLLYRNRFLFTGDHLWWSDTYGSLHASYRVCWYDWREQTSSMEQLLKYDFEWVLPGHGRRTNQPAEEMQRMLQDCVLRMKQIGKSRIYLTGDPMPS